MKKIDQDLHKYPAAIRYKFLELLGIKQKTIKIPEERFRLNLVEHFRDESREKLEKRTKQLALLPSSEGNVVYAAARPYQLTSGKRPYMSLKFHNSTTFTAIVLNSVETKTKGVYNLEYGILAGNRPTKEKDTKTVDGKKVLYVGKSFSTKENPAEGAGILIEVETVNITFDARSKTFDLSGWAPRYLGITDRKPQTMEEIEKQAMKDHVFQAKLIDKDGKVHYLPGKSGEEVGSK